MAPSNTAAAAREARRTKRVRSVSSGTSTLKKRTAESGSKTAQIRLKRSQNGIGPTTPSMKVLTYQRPVLVARMPKSQRSRCLCVRSSTLAASAKQSKAAMNEVCVRASTGEA